MKELIQKLRTLYPGVEFYEGNENGNKILLYSDRNLMWDSKFQETVLELAEIHLTTNEYNSFAYVYDKF
ncbi:hypothetical protein [uncultured Clostridium sp.]|uniref:hypothetical protein n=1 Tax=uncultured Clostridium sp. TaxID=59620 RepID=UPI0028E83730|nr:hypothetical protein [uncultured Clostridium sp.]